MKEQELLLKELALMLERQDMLSKLTEGKCLDEYGYSGNSFGGLSLSV